MLFLDFSSNLVASCKLFNKPSDVSYRSSICSSSILIRSKFSLTTWFSSLGRSTFSLFINASLAIRDLKQRREVFKRDFACIRHRSLERILKWGDSHKKSCWPVLENCIPRKSCCCENVLTCVVKIENEMKKMENEVKKTNRYIKYLLKIQLCLS